MNIHRNKRKKKMTDPNNKPFTPEEEEYLLGTDEAIAPDGATIVPQSIATATTADPAAAHAATAQEQQAAQDEADMEDWYRYVPKPDHETLARRARRQEQAALLGDIAQLAAQYHATAGKNGGWIVRPLENRYQAARQKRDAVEANQRAAWQDYGARRLSYLMNQRKERAAQEAARQKARQEYDRFMLDYNYKKADLERRIKEGDRKAQQELDRLEFEKKKQAENLALGYAKLGEDQRQFDEKQKNGGSGNKTSIYVGQNPDGTRRFVNVSTSSYNNAAGNVWKILDNKYPDMEEKFRKWVLGEARKYPESFDKDLIAVLEAGKTPTHIKTSKNILNFAHAIDDQDVYDFFIDMAGESRSRNGGQSGKTEAEGVSPASRYYDAYMVNNQSGYNPLKPRKKGNPLLKR